MPEYADLILENAEIITCDPSIKRAEALAVKKGIIAAVGDSESINVLKNAQTRTIDCGHRVLAPGFIDAHCHFFALARKFMSLDLSPGKVNSIEDLKNILSQKAATLQQGAWITGTDYNEFYLKEQRHPVRQDLDGVTLTHPIMIVHRSMHACVLNSLAMQIVGITSETEEPPGGIIDRDLDTGEPNGILFEMLDYVQKRRETAGRQDKIEKVAGEIDRYYLSQGITSFQEATVTNDTAQWRVYEKLKKSGKLHSRIGMMAGMNFMTQFQEAGLLSGTGDNQLRMGPLKIVLNETTGQLTPDQNSLNRIILEAGWAGFQIAVHAVETTTVEAAVKALEYASSIHRQIDARYRIEHCSECTVELRQRLSNLKAVIVSQPAFLYYSGDRYLETVRPEIQPCLYTFKSWLDSGLTVAGSSDSPVVPVNPLMGIYAAVNRRAESGQTVLAGERITAEQALKMFTFNAAYASFEEPIKGSLSPGKLADIIMLNKNPLTCSPEDIKDIQVEMTIIDGCVAWQK
jgi:predicted amidohydrolase YtcJ